MEDIDKLMQEFPEINFTFEKMPSKLGGLTVGNEITINCTLPKSEQYQWLLEEIGHYETSVGDISDYNHYANMQQENKARKWGYHYLMSREKIMEIRENDFETDYEIADDYGLQVSYLHKIGESYGLDFKHIK